MAKIKLFNSIPLGLIIRGSRQHVRGTQLLLKQRAANAVWLLLLMCLLYCGAWFSPVILTWHQLWPSGISDSCDPASCVGTLRRVKQNIQVWVNEQSSPACQEKCNPINIRSFCQDCGGMDLPGNEEKQRLCSMSCYYHGTCRLAGPAEEPHPSCPPYDPSLRDARVALLNSLGATVQPGANYGIDVYGIDIREPWVLGHEQLLCAIQHLTHDYRVVTFKRQKHSCEIDMRACYMLGKAYEGRPIFWDTPRINLISNHPLLGLAAESAEGWHLDGPGEACTHGIFSIVTATPGHGATAFSLTPAVLRGASAEQLGYWKRISWHSVTFRRLQKWFPLLWTHPVTHEPIIYVHHVAGFGIDMDGPSGHIFDAEENRQLTDQLHGAFSKQSFNMSWETGDFAYMDNLALLHRAWPDAADHPDKGLRVLRKANCGCVSAPAFLPSVLEPNGSQ
eukprot:jgi/Mesvir1/27211/Mv07055-RA.1